MFENYLSRLINVAICLSLVLLTTLNAQAQSPTKLLFTQQSVTAADDRLNTVDVTATASFPATPTAIASGAGEFTQPNDLIFDQKNNYIYIVDNTISTGPILRYSYNATANTVSGRTVIVNGTASATYQGLALDVNNNRLYFTQSSADNSLDAIKVVSGLNTNTGPFVVTPLETGSSTTGDFDNPNDLVFDPVNNYLYVIDQFQITGPILRFNTNGTSLSNRTVVVAATGLASAAYGGLALDLANNKLYFTQYTTAAPTTKNSLDAIKSVTLSGSTPYTPTTVIDGANASDNFTQPTDLVLDRANNYLYVANQTASSATNYIFRYTTAGTGEVTVVTPFTGAFYGGVALNGGVTTPVTLVSSTPPDNATGVSSNTNIVLTFDRAVSKGTGNFEIRRTSDNVVVETISVGSGQVTGSGTTWTIDPSITLAGGTTYALRAASGIFTAADGGSYAGIADNTTLNFTTLVPNSAPTDITLSNSSVNENQPVSTVVGSFSTIDADNGQTFTYALVAGTGDTDNSAFQIVGNQLRTNAVFNFETKSTYTVRVQTTDSGTPNLSFQKAFTITVTNLNELAATVTAQANVSCNGGANGSATVTASGENAPFSFTYRNTTTNTTLAQTTSAVTGLTAGAYSVTVTATSSGFTATTSFTIVQPPALSLITSITNVTQMGTATGVASVTVSGGTPAYAYNWLPGNPTGDGTSSITSLSAGSYTVVVSDANSCTASASVTVGTDPDITAVLYARPSLIYGTSSFSVVVDVVETNMVSTTGEITVRITKDAKAMLSFDNTLTSVGTRSVQNGSWTLSSDANYYILTTSQSIAGGNKLSVGLSGMLNAEATTGVINCSATVMGGGETRMGNNIDADKIEYFQQ